MRGARYVVVAAVSAAGLQASAGTVDLVNNQMGSANGALFWRADFQTAGTGVIDPIVRIQHDNGRSNNSHSPNGQEQGYNTSGRAVQYDELTDPNFTKNLLLGEVPEVLIGGVIYKQFILDINEPNGGGHELLSLDKVNIYTSPAGSQTGLEGTLGTLNYSLATNFGDNVVLLDYSLNSGSGQGDMQMYVPLSNFAGAAGTDFVYLYSYFGHLSNAYDTGDGFEEWAVRRASPPVIPLPTAWVMGLAGLGVVASRRRR